MIGPNFAAGLVLYIVLQPSIFAVLVYRKADATPKRQGSKIYTFVPKSAPELIYLISIEQDYCYFQSSLIT